MLITPNAGKSNTTARTVLLEMHADQNAEKHKIDVTKKRDRIPKFAISWGKCLMKSSPKANAAKAMLEKSPRKLPMMATDNFIVHCKRPDTGSVMFDDCVPRVRSSPIEILPARMTP